MFYQNLARLTFLLVAINSAPVFANTDIQKDILGRITQSEKELLDIEKNISQKSSQLNKRLDEKQNQIAALRKEAASAQRLIDEQLLSLDQLKNRVERWETQNTYQTHLLNAYIESTKLPTDTLKKMDGEIIVDAQILDIALDHLHKRLSPTWQEQDIITPKGSILKVQSLTVGPVSIAYDPDTREGGPLVTDIAEESRMLDILSNSQQEMLQGLYSTGQGYLIFDPTLGNANKLMNHNEDLKTHLVKGGIWVIPIILFGIFAFIIAVIKAIQLLKLPKVDEQLSEKILYTIKETPVEDPATGRNILREKIHTLEQTLGGAQARLVQIALNTPMSQRRDDLLVAYLMEHKHRVERFMGVVATSAAIAPLLGLLGTVSGMISMFKMMTIFGSGDASTVSGGISEALITTELGLIVAIPSLIVSALLTRKAKSYNHKLETFAIKLSKIKFGH